MLPCYIKLFQVWFQNARAKFRRNLLRQENTGVDKTSDSTLQAGTPSGPASEISNASMSPSSTPTTLTDLTNPTMPTVTSVLTSVPGSLEVHESRSPSQTTLTNLFWWLFLNNFFKKEIILSWNSKCILIEALSNWLTTIRISPKKPEGNVVFWYYGVWTEE